MGGYVEGDDGQAIFSDKLILDQYIPAGNKILKNFQANIKKLKHTYYLPSDTIES
jgi:hypothetical protein